MVASVLAVFSCFLSCLLTKREAGGYDVGCSKHGNWWQGTEGGLKPTAMRNWDPQSIACEGLNAANNHVSELEDLPPAECLDEMKSCQQLDYNPRDLEPETAS